MVRGEIVLTVAERIILPGTDDTPLEVRSVISVEKLDISRLKCRKKPTRATVSVGGEIPQG